MQDKHFWYRGRHRFLLASLDRHTRMEARPLSAVDLGGGAGGWVRYLSERRSQRFSTLALADSSENALIMAKGALPANIAMHQIDIMNLHWEDCWDVAFLLDVIEHLPDDAEALMQAAKGLKAGGYLFITAPAIQRFWNYNDELVSHLRRYNRQDLKSLSERTGLQLCDARYFMFFLSPLYWLTRRAKNITDLNQTQKQQLLHQSHKVPMGPINAALFALFAAESTIGQRLQFPWGTSILGVFRKV
ncbi:class I SAM-dependent methyltransferase [Zwartia hollandica]